MVLILKIYNPFRIETFLQKNKEFCLIQVISKANNFQEFKSYPNSRKYFKPMIDDCIQLVKNFPQFKVLFPTVVNKRNMLLSQRLAKMIETNSDHFTTDLTLCWNSQTSSVIFSYLIGQEFENGEDIESIYSEQIEFVNQDYMGMISHGKAVNT